MIIYKQDIQPDILFRELTGSEIIEFAQWARSPENQTEEHLKKSGVYHPVVRAVYEELGLITIVDKATDE